jgi:ribonuclease-3
MAQQLTALEKSQKAQQILGFHFQCPNLLQQALTHSSFANEERQAGRLTQDFERLEWLGDAVLKAVVSVFLHHELSDTAVGLLTDSRQCLESDSVLAKVAENAGLHTCLFLGHGTPPNSGIHADALEALIGAVYCSSSFERATALVYSLFARFWSADCAPLTANPDVRALLPTLHARFERLWLDSLD